MLCFHYKMNYASIVTDAALVLAVQPNQELLEKDAVYF